MLVSPIDILPSQDFLKPKTIAFILSCITSGSFEQLPPTPIVRRNLDGKFVAIDGHNLIAVRLYLGEDIEVHVASSADDGLPATTAANIQRNQDLKEKYNAVIDDSVNVQSNGVNGFQQLIEKYKVSFTD